MGSTLSLESYLILINPQFMLYHAPINSSIIFPTQLDRFMKKLNLSSSIINGSHNLLSDKLISQHKTDCPFSRIPHYTYDDLQKGIICPECHSFLSRYKEMNLICETCGNVENWEIAVLRSVEELKLLFPGRKITTKWSL